MTLDLDAIEKRLIAHDEWHNDTLERCCAFTFEDEARDLIAEVRWLRANEATPDALRDIYELSKRQETAAQIEIARASRRWISVTEKLPERGAEVWVSAKFGQCVGTWDDPLFTSRWTDDDRDDIEGVTHWMPLPEPPGAEKTFAEDVMDALPAMAALEMTRKLTPEGERLRNKAMELAAKLARRLAQDRMPTVKSGDDQRTASETKADVNTGRIRELGENGDT